MPAMNFYAVASVNGSRSFPYCGATSSRSRTTIGAPLDKFYENLTVASTTCDVIRNEFGP